MTGEPDARRPFRPPGADHTIGTISDNLVELADAHRLAMDGPIMPDRYDQASERLIGEGLPHRMGWEMRGMTGPGDAA